MEENIHYTERKDDVTFLVGKNRDCAVRFPANKFILSLQSPVFDRMFNGNFVEKKQPEILILDVEPLAFYELLQFTYKNNAKPFGNTVSHFAKVLYAAEKYQIPKLKTYCIDQLKEREVNFDNVWHFFNVVVDFDMEHMHKDIAVKVRHFFDLNSHDLAFNTEFFDLSYRALLTFIKQRILSFKEYGELFNRLCIWAKMQCCRHNKEETPTNLREILGTIIYYIPFSKMTYEEFINGPVKLGILTDEESRMFAKEIVTGGEELPHPWKSVDWVSVTSNFQFTFSKNIPKLHSDNPFSVTSTQVAQQFPNN